MLVLGCSGAFGAGNDPATEVQKSTGTSRDDNTSPSARAESTERIRLKEVVVVGTRLATAAGQTSQDIHIYDHERVEQSGQSTVAEFLGTLPEVSLLSPENATLSRQLAKR